MERLELTITEDDSGTRLDRFIRRHHPEVNQGRIEKLLRGGVIRVDGAKVKSSHRLLEGMAVSMPKVIILDSAPKVKPIPTADPKVIETVRDAFVAKGEGWLALNKPSGLATQGGSGTKHHVDGALSYAFPEYEKLRLVHRLDRDTSGLLVVATDLAMSRHLARGFQRHDHDKTYLALVLGVPKIAQGKISAPLMKVGGRGHEKMAVDDDGQSATTFYRVIEQIGHSFSLVAMRPKTGRTHQLRVHMSYLGCPILGDAKYGGEDALQQDIAKRLCLHSAFIGLDLSDASGGDGHRGGGRKVELTAPLPEDLRGTLSFLGLDSGDALARATHPDCFEEI